MFGPLRTRLTEFVGALRERGVRPSDAFRKQKLDIAAQEKFARFVIEKLGFDLERGRLDRSTHPFSLGTHPTDVRLTTRFQEHDVLDALGSTMHEAGHGMYEQGLLAEHWGTPMGESVSLGIHESQSRLWENQVGRGRAFWSWCHPHLRQFFGADVKSYSFDDVLGAANMVEPSCDSRRGG